MPFDQKIPDPPDGGFGGLEGFEQWEAVVAGVEHQVNQLTQLPYQPAVRHELLRVLEERRRVPQGYQREPGRPEASDAARGQDDVQRSGADLVTQFDYLPVRVGYDTLFARGELLITRQSYGPGPAAAGQPGQAQNASTEDSGGTAKTYLDALGIQAEPVACPELAHRVLRLYHPGRDLGPEELADLARNLRTRGFSASLTNISCTAPVHKLPPLHPGSNQPSTGTQARVLRIGGPERSGTPARVAIIDTGIDKERLPGVEGEPDHMHEFPRGEPRAVRDEYLDFDAGHGTFVAGIVLQIAPDAEIKVYRAVDSDGIGSEVTVACKMIQAVLEGYKIINLSLSCQTQDDFPPVAIQAALEVIKEIERDRETPESHRALFIAAAGNYGNTRPSWPAAFPGVVAVAGLGPGLQPSLWSSRGFWVDCSTIGEGVLSTYVPGRESPLVTSTPVDFMGPAPWALWSGTSFAAPQIAGILARAFQASGTDPREALGELLAAGQPIPEFGQSIQILPGV
jgi:subtilisin family serine protease